MLHKTEGVVLRVVKYGETSVVASILTEMFGIQSYMINGVRSSAKGKAAKGNILQPAAVLDMVVYHNDKTTLQRVSEFRLGVVYENLKFNVVRNAIALYYVEVLTKCLREPESDPQLFEFVKQHLIMLDQAPLKAVANLPLVYTLGLFRFLGFYFNGMYTAETPFLDLKEGSFMAQPPHHGYFLEGHASAFTSAMLQAANVDEAMALQMNGDMRRKLLYAYIDFIRLHLVDFKDLNTPSILHEVLS
jgi:DNA repair protein RecO (recombination protein O)